MRGARVATLLGAVALLAAGCAQQDAHRLCSPDDAGPSAEALAESTLPTLDDLPDGWTTLPGSRTRTGSGGGDDEFQTDMAECLGSEEAVLNLDDAYATTPYFVSPGGDTAQLSVFLLPDEDRSRRFTETVTSEEARGCFDETFLAANTAGPGPELRDVSTVVVPYADLGNTTTAWRTSLRYFDGPNQLNVYVDYVAVRVGRAMINASFQSQDRPYDRDQSERVMFAIVDRVTEAVAEEA
jgi:hypothetical protein